MKKVIFVLIFLLSTFLVYSQSNIHNTVTIDYLFNNYDVKTEDLHLWIYNFKSKSQLAGIVFSRDGNINLYVGTSGYYLKLSEIEITESFLSVSFIKIWIGAEESNTNDSRLFMKYKVIVDKETIENNTSWVLEIFDVQPIFKAKDSYNSLRNYNFFSVKENTEVKKDISNNSETVFHLSSENRFDIIDINCTGNDTKDLWLKIFCNGEYGFIPFCTLAENWEIVQNNLCNVMEDSLVN